jgi:hypothetical protein
MNSSYDSHDGSTGTKSGVIVLVAVVLTLLAVPLLLAVGFVGFFTFSRVEIAPGGLQEIEGTIPGTSVGVDGANATLTSNGVTITAVTESGQINSQINSSGSRLEARLGTHTIVLDNSRLRINDVDYGAVQPGDQVRLEGGRLTINGQERSPAGEASATAPSVEPAEAIAEQVP